MAEDVQETPVSVTITVTIPSVFIAEATALYQQIKGLYPVSTTGRVSLRVDESRSQGLRPLTRVR